MDTRQTIISFCDNMHIPLIISTPNLNITFYNDYAKMLLDLPINLRHATDNIEKLLTHSDNELTSYHNTTDETLTLRWYQHHQGISERYISIKVVKREKHNHDDRQTIKQLIAHLPASVLIKDQSGSYLYANEHHTQAARATSIIGRKDVDLPWCESAHKFREHDAFCFTKNENEPYYFIEQQAYRNDNNQLIHNTMLCATHHKNNQLYGFSMNLRDIHQSLFVKYAQTKGATDANIDLSTREMECINWLVEGKSSSEIATILGISRKTVEWHIANIKQKFGCYKLTKLAFLIGKFHGYFIERDIGF